MDKGALTGRVGYTHPTPAVRLRPTPGGPIVPAVLEASGAKLRTMAHIPVAWAAPTQPMRQARPGPPRELRGGGSEIPNYGQWRISSSRGLRPPDDCARPPPGPEPRALPLAIAEPWRAAVASWGRAVRSGAGRPPQPRWRALAGSACGLGVDPPVRPR